MNNAIKYRGDYPEALAARGIAYASKGKFKEAVSDLTAAISASPKNGSAYFNRAIVYLNTNKKELACIDLKKATDLGFTDAFQVYSKECLKK
jgi:Flp pilus assembly protein TadD